MLHRQENSTKPTRLLSKKRRSGLASACCRGVSEVSKRRSSQTLDSANVCTTIPAEPHLHDTFSSNTLADLPHNNLYPFGARPCNIHDHIHSCSSNYNYLQMKNWFSQSIFSNKCICTHTSLSRFCLDFWAGVLQERPFHSHHHLHMYSHNRKSDLVPQALNVLFCGREECFCSALRLWRRGNIALVTTLPGRDCLNLVHTNSPSLWRTDSSLSKTKKNGTAKAQSLQHINKALFGSTHIPSSNSPTSCFFVRGASKRLSHANVWLVSSGNVSFILISLPPPILRTCQHGTVIPRSFISQKN